MWHTVPISSVTYILLELDRQIMSYYSPINSCNRLIGSIKLNMEPTINSTTNPSRAKICTSYSDIRRLSIYEYAIFVLKSSYIVSGCKPSLLFEWTKQTKRRNIFLHRVNVTVCLTPRTKGTIFLGQNYLGSPYVISRSFILRRSIERDWSLQKFFAMTIWQKPSATSISSSLV